ncbi:MAG: response regulator [Alphaproteobacteria bacterium]|nr:response regulator [Alphaproteobacteria bacterium]
MPTPFENFIPSIPILVIEDELEIQKFLSNALTSHGYKVTLAENGRIGLQQAVAAHPELIILDLGLPDMDGHHVIQSIREWSQLPIIILSARGQEREKVYALENGADDYLTKPFGLAELLARMKVALKHHRQLKSGHDAVFSFIDLSIDFNKRLVLLKNEIVHLTPIEYQLLSILAKHAGKVMTYSQLLKEIWGKHALENNNYLRIHMQHLRQKLNDDPIKPIYLNTEPGVGYRLNAEE